MKVKLGLILAGLISFPIISVKAETNANLSIIRANDLSSVKTSAQYLTQNNIVTITNIELKNDNSDSRLFIETDTTSSIKPIIMPEGNNLIIEILSVKISPNIPSLFTPDNDDSNIEQIEITSLEEGGIRIIIKGKNTPLKADIVNLPVGFAFDIQKSDTDQNAENQIEIIATGEREAEEEYDIVPQVEIRRQEILDRPDRSLGDVIQQLPGVLMDGPPGENKDVRLRGLDKEFTRLQIDGVTLPDGGEKREFQTNRLPSFFVDNVRVIRNSSAEYEGDGIAGRIAVDTIPIPDLGEYVFEGRVGYGGQNTLTGGYWDIPLVLGERPTENFGYVTGLNYGRNPIDVDKVKTFSDGKTETETEFKDQTFKNSLLKVGYFYDQGEIILQPLAFSFEELKDKTKINETPATKPNQKSKIDRDEEKEDQSRDTWGIGIEHNHRFDNGIALASQMGYYTSGENKDKTTEKFKQDIFDKTQLEEENKQDSIWNFTNNITIPIEGDISQEIKLGVAFRFRDRFRDKTREEIDKKGKIKDITEGKDNYDITENYFAGFIQNQIFITDSFSILPGVRIEHVDLTTGTKSGISDVSKSITDVLPSLHFLYQPISDLNFNLAFSRSLNRPKFDELSPFIDDKGDRLVIGNPELSPARSWNVDVGGKYETEYVVFGLNFFQRWIDGVIEEVALGKTPDGDDLFQVQNVGDGWTNGFELEQKINLGFTGVEGLNGLTLWANQTFLSSELEDSFGNKKPFKEQPDFISNLGFDYNYEPWGTVISLYWNYIGDRRDFQGTGKVKTIQAASTLNLGIRQRITDNFGLFFDAFNLTNAKKIETEVETNGNSSRKEESFGQTYIIGINWQF